jgi:hypothetical protein
LRLPTAVLLAADLGEHANTTAAVTGPFAGTLHGAAGIPQARANQVAWRAEISAKATRLDAGIGSPDGPTNFATPREARTAQRRQHPVTATAVA